MRISSFILSFIIFLFSSAVAGAAELRDVVISEVGWMGTAASANDEWIEIFNTTGSAIDLAGWHLNATDGAPSIALSGTIAAGSYFLLERTDDTTVSDVAADLIYTGTLGNTGEILQLLDAASSVVDEVDSWHAGNNDTKASMERVRSDIVGTEISNWASNNGVTISGLDSLSSALMATPRAQNSIYAEPSDVTAPDEVTDVVAVADFTQVDLTWVASISADLDHYNLYIDSGSGYDAGASLGAVTAFTATGLTNDVAYTFKITAMDVTGNESIGVTVAATPVSVVTIASAGEVLISEVAWAGSSISTSDEWIELQNTTSKGFDLTGWIISGATSGGGDLTITSGMLAADSYFLIANNTENHTFTGGESVLNITPDFISADVSLSNSDFALILKDSADTEIDSVDDGGTPASGDSATPASMVRLPDLSPGAATRAVNFDASIPDLGTPGAANFLDDDLTITSLSANTTVPLPDEVVTFTVSFQNVGLNEATSFTIELWQGDPAVDGVKLDEVTIDSLASFVTDTVTFDQTVSAGRFDFYAQTVFAADLDNANDQDTATITVSKHLLLSEIVPDPEGADTTEEWIELYNPTAAAIDLENFTIGGITLDAATIDPAAFAFVKADYALRQAQGDTELAWTGSWTALSNTADTVELRDAADGLVDSFTYTTVTAGGSHAREDGNVTSWMTLLHPTQGAANSEINTAPTAVMTIQNSGATNGSCTLYTNLTAEDSSDSDGDTLTYSWDFGNGESSTNENPAAFYFSTGEYTVTLTVSDSLTTDTVTQVFTVSSSCGGGGGSSTARIVYQDYSDDIQMNELLPDPEGLDTEGEWIELFNSSDIDVDLAGWQLDDVADGGSSPYTFPVDSLISAQGYLSVLRQESGIALNNDGDSVRLLSPDSLVKDELTYTRARVGESYARQASGSWLWTDVLTLDEANASLTDWSLSARQAASDELLLYAVMPNPKGADRGKEWLQIQNLSAEALYLTGWTLATSNGIHTFTNEIIPPVSTVSFPASDLALTLTNTDDTLTLRDTHGDMINSISWHKAPDHAVYHHSFQPFGSTEEVTVVRGVDGDTIKVLIDDESYTVRFLGVNTLEKNDRDPAIRELAFAATVFTHQALREQTIRLSYDERVFDAYGRLLAYIYLPDGTLFNEELIRQGYSEPYLRFPFRLSDRFAALGAAYTLSQQEWSVALDPLAILSELSEEELVLLTEELDLVTEEQDMFTDQSVVLSEFLPNPAGVDMGMEWFELRNLSDADIDLLGWQVLVGSSQYIFETSEIITAGAYRTFTGLLPIRNSGGEFRLLDAEGQVMDAVEYPSLKENTCYALSFSGWEATTLATPDAPNNFLSALSSDADADGLSDEFELELGTDPYLFDTDGDGLPDRFELETASDPTAYDSSIEQQQMYRRQLTQLARGDLLAEPDGEQGVVLSGQGIPGGIMRLFLQSELQIIDVPVDADGSWSYALDTELAAGDHHLFMQPLDPLGFAGVAERVLAFTLEQDFMPPTFAEGIIISEVLPNPAGADTEGEFIEIQNTGAEVADLTDWKLQIGSREYQLPAITLQPDEFHSFTHAETGLTLPNTSGEVSLMLPTGRVVSSLGWENAKDDHAFTPAGETVRPTSNAANSILAPITSAKKPTAYYHNGDLSDAVFISEVLPNPIGSDTEAEFIELWNSGTIMVNLGNWTLSEASGRVFILPDSFALNEGEYRTLTRSDTKLALNNSGTEFAELRDWRGELVFKVGFVDLAEGVSMAYDNGAYRNTRIPTPAAMNIFDTQRLSGMVRYVGEAHLILETDTGELSIHLPEQGVGLLARAVLRAGEQIDMFVRESAEGFVLDSFQSAEKLPLTVSQIQARGNPWLPFELAGLTLAFGILGLRRLGFIPAFR